MAYASDPAVPDLQQGGMTSSEKGKGMLHNLHFGEMVLNHPTTKKLLKALGIGLAMARKLKPEDLMKKVKEMIDALPSRAEGGVSDTPAPAPRVSPAKDAPSRKKGGVSEQQSAKSGLRRGAYGSEPKNVRVSPAKDAPSRKKGGVADTGRVKPVANAPSRKAGGMSEAREERDRALGRLPMRDQL